jgi:hypothetical protein
MWQTCLLIGHHAQNRFAILTTSPRVVRLADIAAPTVRRRTRMETSMTQVAEKSGHDQDHGQGHTITVTIDGQPKPIRQGRYLVSELKTVLGVSADLELDQVENGEFKPLDDNNHINVKEGDVFVSHVRRGGAS